jgi:flavodoxin
MNIGIVVYSQTGNTHSVATRLYNQLIKKGYKVTLDKIEAKRDMKKSPNIFEISKRPNIEKYNVIIFASYVEAFSLCPVMKKYLEDIKSLNDKKIAYFVTELFPYAWMGGNHAINKMKYICEAKGATSLSNSIVNWKNKHREELIKKAIHNITSDLKNLK